ncbi:unnamed protein product [Blepharisma stoltei]|uniref:Uncharacterized protein n=1 Tax=Blepharisma stoltei TaxID=1481888 RepID=A0AAU9JHB3_9CILI|nr:unnamed protein product [Blepharisma stoltei]
MRPKTSHNFHRPERCKSATPAKSSKSRRSCTSSRLCPLSDPSIGIISENDHKVGLCLCKYCECGEHLCPSARSDNSIKATFRTKYNYDYQPSNFDIPLRQQQKLYTPNPYKLESQTTNKIEYKPFKISPKHSNDIPLASKSLEFRSRTAYISDYPNWGPNIPSIEKRYQPPVYSTEIPFKGESSYRTTFHQFSKETVDLYKTDLTKASISTIQIAPKDKLNDSTTYRDTMRGYSKIDLNAIVKVLPAQYQRSDSVPSHFRTTSGTVFQKTDQFTKDPRQLRLILSGRRQKY